MKLTFQIFCLTLLTSMIISNVVESQEVYQLYEKSTPYYIENSISEYEKEVWGTKCVFDVTKPTLTIYDAKGKNTKKAVLIIPGGGYGLVAMHHEGFDIAEVLSKFGITAAVLKYRIPNPKTSDHPNLVPLSDGRRSLKLLRELSEKYGFEKKYVGVMGFSAGSHLSTVLSLWNSKDKEESPDFSALIYGVTNLSPENLKWLEESLYYRKLTLDEIKENTLLELVTKKTPPAFIVHAYDDEVCKVEESTLYADKLLELNVKVEMHLFQNGGHGFGLGRKEDGTDQWIHLFINWLNNL